MPRCFVSAAAAGINQPYNKVFELHLDLKRKPYRIPATCNFESRDSEQLQECWLTSNMELEASQKYYTFVIPWEGAGGLLQGRS